MECCSEKHKLTRNSQISASMVLIPLIVLFLDRSTKLYALHNFLPGFALNKYMYFQLVFNKGISWGILNYSHKSIFFFVTTLVLAVTLWFAWYTYQQFKSGVPIFGELLVLAGSLSNIIDRFWYGGVIDFIGVRYNDWYFPVFNIADSAVVLGIALLFFKQLSQLPRPKERKV